MARLAAALQPAEDPRGPIELALQAIAAARDSGDGQALLAALGAGCSTMMDLEDPARRAPLSAEHLDLARRLGDHAGALRAATRLAVDRFELGDLAGARTASGEVRRLAGSLDHPAYRWRAAALDAAWALWEGRFEEAERAIEEAARMGQQGHDPNAPLARTYQRATLLALQGRAAELEALLPEVRQMFAFSPGVAHVSQVIAAAFQVQVRPDAAPDLPPGAADEVLRVGDNTAVLALARIARATGDRKLARRLVERLKPRAGQMVSGGVIGMTWDGPVSWALALAEQTLGRQAEAEARFQQALKQARATGGKPCLELIARDRAATRAEAPPADAPPLAPDPVGFQMLREGDYWTLSCGQQVFRLRDVKGLQLLARLVSEPGRELHVLDLAGAPPDGDRRPDAGDAGEMIDPRARAEYQARVAELEEELAEAEAFNDPGRAGRARAELEFIARELSRAVGLSGRHRRAGSAAERARVNVQRRLRDAIRRIEQQSQPLARHLQRSVRTGTFCCYSPE
jgi:hypothetical protein